MLPEDIQDLIVAGVLLVLLIGLGIFLERSGYINSGTSDSGLKDEAGLFLLNYLRTETDSGEITDRIILNEGKDYQTLVPLQSASKQILNFYGLEDRGVNYILKVKYPDGTVRFLAASHKWELPKAESMGTPTEEQKKLWFELGDGEKIKIPALTKGEVIVEFKLENE